MPPINPLPMKPIVVMTPPTPARRRSFLGVIVSVTPGPQRAGHGLGDFGVVQPEPAGQDPAGFRSEHGGRALARRLDASVPLADLVVDDAVAPFGRWLEFLDGKFAALHAAAPLVAGLPSDQVARQVARLAGRLGLNYAEVTAAVTGALRPGE